LLAFPFIRHGYRAYGLASMEPHPVWMRKGGYVVCQASQVDSRDLSSEYIRLHDGDAKQLEASFERVQATAAKILFLVDEVTQPR